VQFLRRFRSAVRRCSATDKEFEMIDRLMGGNLFSSLLNLASMMIPQLQLFKAVLNMMNSVMGPAINNAMSQLSKEAGMPKFIKDGVNDLAEKTFGGQKETSAAATEQVAGTGGDAKAKFTENVKAEREESEKKSDGKSGGNGRTGWLLALAKAFGKVADAAAAELKAKGENIDKENPSSMLEYQALTQEFNLMMQTFTNAIKTIGEAEGQAVRKG
jgi:Type III secretion needle MxiH, YscF, SsaG, EprI, PscF, EscF